jgi:hypothetical protein
MAQGNSGTVHPNGLPTIRPGRPSVSRNPGQRKEVFLKLSGTFGLLVSYSDKRAPWVEKELIFCVELSTFWY